MAKLKKLFPFFYITALAVLILGPLLKPGYVFFLDFVMAPEHQLDLVDYISGGALLSSLPFDIIIHFLVVILPASLAQKIILLSVFLVTGLAMWRALPERIGLAPRLLATTFYMVNPFVYERFTAGQFGILFGYAFLPLILKFFYQSFAKKDNASLLLGVLFWTAQIIFATHFLVITGVCLVIIFMFHLLSRRSHPDQVSANDWEYKKNNYRIFTKIFLKIVLLFFVFNSFWLIPPIFSQNPTISQFDTAHFAAYRSAADNRYGLTMNLIGMYGFWRERTSAGEFALAKDALQAWSLLLAIFFIPMYFGGKYLYKREPIFFYSLLACVSLGVVFSIGPQLPVVGSINRFIFSYVPAWRGLRESQKFISLVVVSYSFFLAYGLWQMREAMVKLGTVRKNIWHATISGIVLITIFVYNYSLFWAANGQLESRSYPASWQAAEEIFDQDMSNYKILILPWHMYVIGHSLTPKRTIVDPAPKYFSARRLVFSSDEEMGYVPIRVSTDDKKIVSLLKSVDPTVWLTTLREMGIKYIFVSKVADVRRHGFDQFFLVGAKNITKLIEDEYAFLFRLE